MSSAPVSAASGAISGSDRHQAGGLFETIARIMNTVADIQSATASIDLTQAGWQRRSVEWFHQTQTLPIEIQQIELQILGAQRRRDQALQELNNQQRQIEQRDRGAGLPARQVHRARSLSVPAEGDLRALLPDVRAGAARGARRPSARSTSSAATPRGSSSRRNLGQPARGADGRRAAVDVALRHMEKAYLDENVREYELTKHFSLRCHFPIELFAAAGQRAAARSSIPEWMFDLDYPGQYMRRIKNVTLTIPCVTGPYTGVHCRVTLLSSMTRIDPRLDPPPTRCCCECGSRQRLRSVPARSAHRSQSYAAREAIATSSGQNDSGLFELNFRDERYLPFEYQGAVSRWRIELPPENNYFDMDTLSDVIFNLNYTAREGGETAAHARQWKRRGAPLPGDGLVLLRRASRVSRRMAAFPPVSSGQEIAEKTPADRWRRNMFPFIPGHREIWRSPA